MTEPADTPTKPKRAVEGAEYVAMMGRMIAALERRATEDPSILPEVVKLVDRLAEVPNVAIAECASKYKISDRLAPSAGELSTLLGMSKQAVSLRRKTGDRILFDRATGSAPLSRRERAARTKAERAAARRHVAEALSEWLARR